jgi:molybdopterin/thiamine biosynthesis adenylyltransferase/predicted RNA-binding Zn-ribbon protein involved in translation (DUF1610 family)
VAAEPPPEVRLHNRPRATRYDRQAIISWWEQKRLTDARVLIVGAGALGNELAKNLALLGIGTVVVIDLDVVENSNLSRCVFFRAEDEGLPKAEVVCQRAGEINPDSHFHPIVGDVRHDLGLGDFADFDIVLGGLDNREARMHVNEACWKSTTPWIDGAIEGLQGLVRVFVPPESACYECTLNDGDLRLMAMRRSCSLLTRDQMLSGKVPTTATSGSVIAGMQVMELVKLLHADRIESYAGKAFVFVGETYDCYPIVYRRRDDCMSHNTYDLTAAKRVPADRPLRDILRDGRDQIGDPGAVLKLETEILMALQCPNCGTEERVRLPYTKVPSSRALCPQCGKERKNELRHGFEPEAELDFSAEDIGLPPNDVVTIIGQSDRVHVLVGTSALPKGASA